MCCCGRSSTVYSGRSTAPSVFPCNV
jgi:hypothetical protein